MSAPGPERARGKRLRFGSATRVLLAGVCLCTVAAGGTSSDHTSLTDLPLGPREAPQRPPLFLFAAGGFPDPVEQVLDEAEAAFRRGEKHYEAGHLESAREDFDRAIDLLLTSPFDLRKDPRLRFGFDRLADRIYQLELAALQEAAAAEEPPGVPAPIEEIAPLTFPLDPRLRSQVEQELATLTHDLPVILNERVLSVVNFFQTAKGRRILQNGLRRAGRYRELISSILEEEGLPQDLIYVAQAESAFQPHARSRARAVGLWQFLSWRAREYGLEVNWWVDERRDPVKATVAAARHLRDLYQEFKDWYLALAAYNGGPGRVRRALRRAGDGADFWKLVDRRLLPRETRNFVPIILAVSLVAKNPDRYGVEVELEPPLRYETVKVDKPTDLRRIAEVIGVDVGVLQELNPHLIRNVTPPDYKDFELYVPPGTAETLRAELPRIPESKRVLWQRHRVRRGETLSHIAARYGTSAYAIAQANRISLRSLIYPGQVLVIPRGRRLRGRSLRAERQADGRLVYTVRRGDSLSLIAALHGTSAGALARANGISTRTVIHPGDRLVIPERGRAARVTGGSNGRVVYTVRRGDSLSSIAARHATSVRTLARANGISVRSVIHPGDRLVIPGGEGVAQAARGRSGKIIHRVRWGETLWELARHYQVSVHDLRRANPYLLGRQLRAGDRLVIPQ